MAALGMQSTAPQEALRLYERWQMCKEMGWTFAEYDRAGAGDVLLAREFARIQAEAQKKALEGPRDGK